MVRSAELLSAIIIAAVGLVTLGYMAFGPMNCDSQGSCYGTLNARDVTVAAGFLTLMALAIAIGVGGTYLSLRRGGRLGRVLQWLSVVLLVLDRFYPIVGVFLGLLLLPTTSAALSAAIFGASAEATREGIGPLPLPRDVRQAILAVGTSVGLFLVGTILVWGLEYPGLGVLSRIMR
jgi:hypothetical protein